MDKQRAFEILDLDESATEEEIEERFREIVREEHPDIGGNSIDMDRISEARKTAIREPDKSLVNYQENLKPSLYNREYEREKEKIQKEINRIKRKHTSKYRRYKQLTKITGGFFGILLLTNFLTVLFDVQAVTRSTPFLLMNEHPYMTSLLFYISLAIAFAHWILITKIRNIDLIVEEAEEALSQKPTILNVMSELDVDYEEKSISNRELEEAMNEWITDHDKINSVNRVFNTLSVELDLGTVAIQMGASDFKRLFVRKCVENGILEEKVALENGNSNVTYILGEAWSSQESSN